MRCAEWEPSEGIILANYWKSPDTVNRMQEHNLVYIQVNNQAQIDVWTDLLNNHGIPLTNIRWLEIPVNIGSMRDCAPWFIWDGNNEMAIVNNTCWQGGLPLDDEVPFRFAQIYRYPYYDPSPAIYGEGGNFYPNGYGIAFASSYTYADNKEKSKELTDSLFRDWLGIEVYRTPAPYTIWHHDTWGKPANPERMIVVRWPRDHKNYPVGEGMAAYYETLMSPWGGPYEIHRLPMFSFDLPGWGPTFKPYMNSVISNKQVYVPITHDESDLIALRIFEAAFPGYEVIGVDHKLSQWEGSLHCATKNIHARDIIRLYPIPPRDTEDETSGYTVTADVITLNGASLLPGYPVIHWTTTGGEPYSDLVMDPTGQAHAFTAVLPPQPQGTTVSLWIEAQDDGGRTAIYPPVAPDGLMEFDVRADSEAPVLSRLTPARGGADGQWPPSLRVLCKDDMATPEVHVESSLNGLPQPDVLLTREEGTYWYSGTLGGSASSGDVLSYRLVGSDGAAVENSAALPLLGEIYLPVTPSAQSVGVVNLAERPYSAPKVLAALGGLDIPHHLHTEWPTDFGAHDTWLIFLGVFAYNHVLTTDQVNDILTACHAGKSIYLEGGDTWCYDAAKDRLQPWFGVAQIKRGGSMQKVTGEVGSMLDGLTLAYGDQYEDICVNRFKAVDPAEVLLLGQKGRGVVVAHDAGSYRTIASSVPLGALLDTTWPHTGKEILLRYLGFLGVERPALMLGGTAQQGTQVPLRLEGTPGEQYVVCFSFAEQYLQVGPWGTLRLDPTWLGTLATGTLPPGGAVEIPLDIPQGEGFAGLEVHFQALLGAAPLAGQATLTNREIVTVEK